MVQDRDILILHATLQDVRITSAMLKIVFRHILFFFVFLIEYRIQKKTERYGFPNIHNIQVHIKWSVQVIVTVHQYII